MIGFGMWWMKIENNWKKDGVEEDEMKKVFVVTSFFKSKVVVLKLYVGEI